MDSSPLEILGQPVESGVNAASSMGDAVDRDKGDREEVGQG